MQELRSKSLNDFLKNGLPPQLFDFFERAFYNYRMDFMQHLIHKSLTVYYTAPYTIILLCYKSNSAGLNEFIEAIAKLNKVSLPRKRGGRDH